MTCALSALQVPLPTVVSVSVALPAVTSAALGVYTALSALLFGAKDPVPPLHTPPAAPAAVPFRLMALLFAHTVPFAPALTVGAGVKVIVRLLMAATHVPLPVVVSVSVSEPAAISAAVGV